MKQIQPKGNLSPFRIAAIYAIAGVLWISFSDRMLFHLIEDPHTLTRFQTYKGWLFITVTALLLYWLINRYTSEMRHSEAVLIESEEKYRSLIDTMQEGLGVQDKNGLIAFMNKRACEMLGYGIEELIGKPATFVFDEENRKILREQTAKRRRGERQSYEITWTRKDGGRIHTIIAPYPIFDEKGNFDGSVAVFTDITEHKRAEEKLIKYKEHLEELVQERTAELKESQIALMNMVDDLNKKTGELKIANERLKEVDRLKSIFIASMSHELRTPLNSVIGFSSILLNEWLGPLNQEQKENLASILRSGKHLLALINDTIDVSKIEAGTIEMHEEDFDVYDVIAEAVNSLSKDVKDKGLELKFESIHQQMLTDRRRLLQCILNLLGNAMKFTEKGNVSVQARLGSSTDDQGEKGSSLLLVANNSTHNADFVEISVEDTGIGIKEEDIPKLFTAFTRLESHLKWYTPGTGLGLYLTKKLIVEALKGDIMVESTYGKGSKFTLRIPLSAERRIQRKFL